MWKLFGTPYVPSKLTLDQVLAVFSARILVGLANTNAASVLAANAVRKHMRLFLGVIDRSVIRSSVPSEPALAIAAAVGLLKSPPRMANYTPAIETFVKELILRKDLLDKGSIGELLARFFLTIARDAALEGTPYVSDLFSVNTVPLSRFLSKLVQQHTMPPALYSFAQRYVTNFTHFYQLSETIFDLSPKFLHHCWWVPVSDNMYLPFSVFLGVAALPSKEFTVSLFGMSSSRRTGRTILIGHLILNIFVFWLFRSKTGWPLRQPV